MADKKIKITAVSYTNTIPFIFGLQNYPNLSDKIELTLAPPAACADAWAGGKADIALVPVGAMGEDDLKFVCCNWGIGAEGAVESVLLLSNDPLEKITTILLDKESRTSVQLASVLSRHFWKITPGMEQFSLSDNFELPKGYGMVVIGDKTFGLAQNYRYSIDLATAWQEMTRLPALFACWLSREDLGGDDIAMVNEALGWGVAHTKEAVKALHKSGLSREEVERYLTECISFRVGERQLEAVKKFFSLRRKA